MTKIIDIKGQRFGRLKVIEFLEFNNSRSAVWKCLCDCGTVTNVIGRSLRKGYTQSCGCLQKENTSNRFKKKETTASRHILYVRYKNGAKNRNLEFNLTEEYFEALTKQNCFYCGIEPLQVVLDSRVNGSYIYNGIDRIDNTKGYTLENSVSCCFMCNRSKDTHTKEEFLKWVERVYKHSIGN